MKKNKTKYNTTGIGYYYTKTNTRNVNKVWALLQKQTNTRNVNKVWALLQKQINISEIWRTYQENIVGYVKTNKQTDKQTNKNHTHKACPFYSTKTSKSYTTANCPSGYNISTRREIHFIDWKMVTFILSSYIFSGLTALVNVHVMYKWFMAFLYPGFELIQ
jgi:hypothetical protein